MTSTPHGGQLVNLSQPKLVSSAMADNPCWRLTERQLCDFECLANGAFSPLRGFLNQADYQAVLQYSRLADGTIWPMPITLDVSPAMAEKLYVGANLTLLDPENTPIGLLLVQDLWQPDKHEESQAIFGTTDRSHPGVSYLLNKTQPYYVGGKLHAFSLPRHYDYTALRHTPAQLRELFQAMGWHKVVGFQTRNPLHRAHQELTLRAAKQHEANLLLHPVVGLTKPGDVDHFTRVRCYQKILHQYPEQTTLLSLLPLAMRMAGPREALWHTLIRKNYGCTHFIIGRDHAGPGNDRQGNSFYSPYAAQEYVQTFEKEIGVTIVPFQEVVYVQNRSQYLPANEVRADDAVLTISGTEFRRRLQKGLPIPDWFSYPDIIAELRKAYPPKHQQGFTVFFTGLSGAGKSTLANALLIKLQELGDRLVTLLDGDIVRQHLSSELTFSKAHRDLNILRIGFVASEITKHRGIALCAPIAPYQAAREQVREMVSSVGGFIEVYVSTPLATCEQRDVKGLYQKARQGLIKGFTGIDDPYEAPVQPELELDASKLTVGEAVQKTLLKLAQLGYLPSIESALQISGPALTA